MLARRFLALTAPILLPAAALAGDDLRVDGALRAMFHEGETGGTVTLDALLPDPHLYAVPDGEAARTERTAGGEAAATLLVSAVVPGWHEVPVESPIAFDELDEAIARLAASAGLAASDRFPFLIEGAVEQLDWHVIDGSRLEAGGSSHADHLAAAVRGREPRVAATLVGFYSPRDQGIFTHRGSRTHLHCLIEEPLAAGHVDHVVVPAGALVRFPAAAKE
jgi:acetolactate decarboxylase